MPWLNARFPGACACGTKLDKGARILWNGGKVEQHERPNQGGPCGGTSTALAVPGALASTTPPYGTRRVLPSTDPLAARAALQALHVRLDADQALVARWRPGQGNLRVVAGAGSGKTGTVVALVGALIEDGVAPAHIIATTFTSKAAGELTERLGKVIAGPALASLRVGTFHSLALRAIRDAGDGGRWDFKLCLDGGRGRAKGIPAAGFLWECVLGEGPIFGTPELGLNLSEADAKAYAMAADVIRAGGAEPGTTASREAARKMDDKLPLFASAWDTFCKAKHALAAWDFADVLAEYRRALTEGTLRDGARVVIVDEAQDNSFVQVDIARLLARDGGNVILVGDCRQSIFEWRGAFPKLFREADVTIAAETLQIRQNYRSGRAIVELGNAIAAGKSWSLGDASRPARTDIGTVSVTSARDPEAEATAIAADIRDVIDGGGTPREIACLTRTNAQLGPLEAALFEAQIPCVVVGGTGFWARRDVQDFLAFAAVGTQSEGAEDLTRVAKASKGLGAAFTTAVRSAQLALGVGPGSACAVLQMAASSCKTEKTRAAAARLVEFVAKARGLAWPDLTTAIATHMAPEGSNGNTAPDDDKPTMAATVTRIAQRFVSYAQLINFVAKCERAAATIGENDELPEGRVTLSTVHRAKGREFTRVYVPCTLGTFPHSRSKGEPDREAEEERLFYTAVTRAKDALILSWTSEDIRGKEAGPSEFLKYVPGFEPPDDPHAGEDGDDGYDDGAEAEDAPAALPATGRVLLVGGEPTSHMTRVAKIAPTERDLPAIPPGPMHTWAPSVFMDQPFVPPVPLASPRAAAEALIQQLACLEQVEHVNHLTEAGLRPVPPSRFVPVTKADFETLLCPFGFTWVAHGDAQARQEVMTCALAGTVRLQVYTTIPLGASEVRDVGEDSIKVALLAAKADGTGWRPLMAKQPYACRTRGWRATLLRKLVFALTHVGPPCVKCGAVTAWRTKGDFWGCGQFPNCRGSAPGKISTIDEGES